MVLNPLPFIFLGIFLLICIAWLIFGKASTAKKFLILGINIFFPVLYYAAIRNVVHEAFGAAKIFFLLLGLQMILTLVYMVIDIFFRKKDNPSTPKDQN